MKKDFLGKEVNVGDCIFYSTMGRWAESRLVEVSRFTEKSVFGTILKHNRLGISAYGQEVVIKNDFVKVEI